MEKKTPQWLSCNITMGTAWVCGFAAYPCRSHGNFARKLFGCPFFHGFWLCVAWVRPKLYLTHAPHYISKRAGRAFTAIYLITYQENRRKKYEILPADRTVAQKPCTKGGDATLQSPFCAGFRANSSVCRQHLIAMR